MISLLRFRDGMASAGWSVRKSRQGRAVRMRECIVPLNWESCNNMLRSFGDSVDLNRSSKT